MQTASIQTNDHTLRTDSKLTKRAVAAAFDYSVYLIVFVWLVKTYGVQDGSNYTLNDPKGWLVFIFWFLYFPLMETVVGGTAGKLLQGLKVATLSGGRISLGQAVKRRLLDCVELFLFGVVAIITVKTTPRHQRVGDLWARTMVVGGDTRACVSCNTVLEISAEEMMDRSFTCPGCGAKNTA